MSVICGCQYSIYHSLPLLLLLFPFLPSLTCVSETTLSYLFVLFLQKQSIAPGGYLFPIASGECYSTIVQFALLSANPQGVFCYLLPYMWTFLCCVWVYVGSRGALGGEQHTLWFLGLTIIICYREPNFSGSVKPAFLIGD